MSPFGGFDMPIQYKGITEEHNAVREACGVFDVSHMGEVIVTGADATRFVNYIFSNDVTPAAPGRCWPDTGPPAGSPWASRASRWSAAV